MCQIVSFMVINVYIIVIHALETPLTVAVRLPKPKPIIMALVAGGAHLDYRAADSYTPLHKAAINGNYEAIKVRYHFSLFFHLFM